MIPNDTKLAVMTESGRLRAIDSDWASLDADLIRAMFANPREIHVPITASQEQLPAMYAYKTRSGEIGVFQIVSYSDKGVTIRISKVAAAAGKP